MPFDFVTGERLLIDKPLEWTSFDVVGKVRGAIRIKKVGHAGTLDPLATGLLILCTGKKTKELNEFQGLDKEYVGVIELGKTTDSFDLEQPVVDVADPSNLTPAQVQTVIDSLTGPIEQIPPMHSAVKVDGKRLYKSARKGEVVEVKPRPVTIYEFEVVTSQLPLLPFRVKCSKGTYIRSLARDIGEGLGVGGYLRELRRTAVGPFRIEDAWPLDKLIDIIHQERRDQQPDASE